jgi:hypothetical protein
VLGLSLPAIPKIYACAHTSTPKPLHPYTCAQAACTLLREDALLFQTCELQDAPSQVLACMQLACVIMHPTRTTHTRVADLQAIPLLQRAVCAANSSTLPQPL